MNENKKQQVLFLCTGNSCRSQMGEGLLCSLAGDRFVALSTGMEPAAEVHPLAVRAMAEIGIDISQQVPMGVRTYLGRVWIRWLIVVCDKANQSCPRVWPLLTDESRLYRPLDDPTEAQGTEAERFQVFRRVRDEIRQRLTDWLQTVPC